VKINYRAVAFVVLALVLLEAGCSSSKGSDQSSSSTATTEAVGGSQGTGTDGSTTTSASSSPVGTVQIDDSPVVNNPDDVKYCASFFVIQTLNGSLSSANFVDDGLMILAAPKQFVDAARAMRESTPPDLNDATNAYANLVDDTAGSVAAANSLRRLGTALTALDAGSTNSDTKPVFDYILAACTDPNADAGQ